MLKKEKPTKQNQHHFQFTKFTHVHIWSHPHAQTSGGTTSNSLSPRQFVLQNVKGL